MMLQQGGPLISPSFFNQIPVGGFTVFSFKKFTIKKLRSFVSVYRFG